MLAELGFAFKPITLVHKSQHLVKLSVKINKEKESDADDVRHL